MLTDEILSLVAQKLKKKEIISILQRKFDMTIPDQDKMSTKEIISFVLSTFEERFRLYDQVKKNKE